MKRREFLTGAAAASLCGLAGGRALAEDALPVVWRWRECSPENLLKALDKVRTRLAGRTAVKLHTGEPHGPNILPPAWVKRLVEAVPDATAVECNVLYASPRRETATHRETIRTNGWDIPVDIMDEDGDAVLPVKDGFHLKEVAVGAHLLGYDSLLVLTHFKGHARGGFGGSLKNIAIGCASGRLGKAQVHGVAGPGEREKPVAQWPGKEWFMEAMADSGKAILARFPGRYACINVLRRLSVDCDCAGVKAAEPVCPDLGILASADMLAVDQASIDLVYALPQALKKDLVERIESRAGLRQLSAMEEHGMGSRRYRLVEEG